MNVNRRFTATVMLCPADRRTQLSTVIPPASRVREGSCKTAHKIVAGIQGARHAQFGISSDLHDNKLQSSPFPIGFQQRDHNAPPPRVPCGKFMDSAEKNGISCLLTIGNSNQNLKEENEVKTPHIVLFGQLILTEQQISKSTSGDTTGNSLSDGSLEKTTYFSYGSGSVLHQNVSLESSDGGSPWYRDHRKNDLVFETGHCKVFLESEDVGRTLDLSVLGIRRKRVKQWKNFTVLTWINEGELPKILMCSCRRANRGVM